MAKYRKSLPDRYVVSFDGSAMFLRKTLSTTQPLSGRGEGTYTVKPMKWTPKRFHEFRAAVNRLGYQLLKDDDQ